MNNSITIRKTSDYEAVAAIHDALYAYNLAKTGRPRVEVRAERFAEQFALVAVDGDGTAHGGLAYHWEDAPRHVFVDYFYLDDALRGTGCGRRIFEEMLKEAEAGGASEVRLTTNTFQAPGFYLKMGFRITGEKPEPAPLCPENIHYTLSRKLGK
jgi:N-acetylglutamate synthase-like GNAT family acetyltransferase